MIEGGFTNDKGEMMVVPTEDERESFVALTSGTQRAFEGVARNDKINPGTLQNMVSNDATHFCMIANSEFVTPAATMLMAKMEALPEYKQLMMKENPLVLQMIEGWAEQAKLDAAAKATLPPAVKEAPVKPSEFERDAGYNISERSTYAIKLHQDGVKPPDAAIQKAAMEDSKDFNRLSSHAKLRKDALYDIGQRMEMDERYRAAMTATDPKLAEDADKRMAQNVVEAARKWAGEKLDGIIKLADKIGLKTPTVQAAVVTGPSTKAVANKM